MYLYYNIQRVSNSVHTGDKITSVFYGNVSEKEVDSQKSDVPQVSRAMCRPQS